MGLGSACRWIDSQLPQFELRDEGPLAWMARLKALGDLAHAGDVLARSSDANHTSGERWLDFATVELDSGEPIRRLIETNPLYVPTAVTALPLLLSGRARPELVEALARQVRRASLPALAWTMLVPTLELCGIEPTAAMYASARSLSPIAQRCPAELIPFDAAYVLAHECMYATRFARALPRWSEAIDLYVRAALPLLAARARAARDPDLWAELALAYRAVTGDRFEGEDILVDAQTPAGNITPVPQLVSIFPRFPHPTQSRTHHTTLVAIMAWA
jgi:hypothetical protein